MSKHFPQGMGWIPDLPDPRDYTWQHDEVLPLLNRMTSRSSEQLPDEVNLLQGDDGEDFFADVDDQGPLDASAVFTVLSLVEYFQRRVYGLTFDGSALFLYKVARNLRNRSHQRTSDTGIDLRTTFKALRQFGIPRAEYWPYIPSQCDEEPPAFVYQAARKVDDFRYFRLGSSSLAETLDANQRWQQLASFLAAGFPIAFGFSVPSSLTTASDIPFRPDFDHYATGATALAVGYRQHHFGHNRPALRIRMSWGKAWGDNGNGWLPAAFVMRGLAGTFWTIVSAAASDSGELTQADFQPR